MAQASRVLLHEVVTSGSTATTMTTGTITALSEGTVYAFQIGCKYAGAGAVFYVYFNGDTTAANYRTTYVTSGNNFENDNDHEGPSSWDDMCLGNGIIAIENGTPSFALTMCQQDGTGGTNYGRIDGVYNSSETSITEVQVTCSAANGLEIGSFIRIWEQIQS